MNKVAETEKLAWDMQETFKNKPQGWIQWKGTGVCMDLNCKCGKLSHIDAEFAYSVQCPFCGTIYFCNGHIELIEVTSPQNDYIRAH